MPDPERTLLLIADGMGLPGTPNRGAITPQSMPHLHRLFDQHGYATLEAAEDAVGLEAEQPGNSEAGHLIIGAGRRIPSLLRGIAESFEDGAWARHPAWAALRPTPRLHLVGLLSDAGVHGHLRSIIQAATLASRVLPGEILIHAALDGVDSVAGSAPGLLRELRAAIEPLARVRLATVMGRKWAMDRSGNLELSRHFAHSLCGRKELGTFSDAALEAHLQKAPEASFPAHLVTPGGAIRPGEPVLFTNHRADRTTQLARVFAEANQVFSLVELGDAVPLERVFFPIRPSDRGLVSELKARGIGLRRVAEQCKFPHVTFFLNGFHDSLGEEAVCIPSIPEARIPETPEMSLESLTQAVLEGLRRPGERAMVANIANLDQVGHTGRMEAAVQAAGHVDRAISTIQGACAEHGWHLLITADHGNAEVMRSEDGSPWGSHTTNPVPLVLVPRPGSSLRLSERKGTLANVAPTLLTTLGLTVPDWMARPLCINA
jgi:2,3-bisphosphoglycerate-independent phosphoglycerate mutase